jgi:Icc-related predicted phosphoesterase
MRLLHLSDTHSRHRSLKNLPSADVIIISDDMCFAGAATEFLDFIEWFKSLDYKYKLFIAGNHDCILHEANAEKLQSFLPENIAYLCNSGVEIEGMKFWGMPYRLIMSDDFETRHDDFAVIPHDIDVLITHEPPYGILDFSDGIFYGYRDLLQTVLKIKPRYHLFGHIHSNYGIVKSKYTTFVNAALMNEAYELANEAILLEL